MSTQQDLVDAVLAKPIDSDKMSSVLADFFQRGLYVTGRDSNERSVETIIVGKGASFFIVPILRNHEANLNEKRRATFPDGLLKATCEGNLGSVRHLVDSNSERPIDFSFLLSVAAQCGHEALVRYFVEEKNVSPDSPGEDGITPLYQAAGNGHVSIIRYLESHGVDIRAPGISHKNIIHVALSHRELLMYLLTEKQFDINHRDYNGQTLAHQATEMGNVACFRFILNFRPQLDIQDRNGQTVLDIANTSVDSIFMKKHELEKIKRDRTDIKAILQIYLAECRRKNDIFRKLESTTESNANLANLRVNNRDLGGIADCLTRCNHVFSLDLSSNELNDDEPQMITAFADLLFANTRVVQVNFNGNHLSSESAHSVNDKIHPSARLKQLMEQYQSPEFGQTNFDKFRLLIEQGADYDNIEVEGWKLVHFAAYHGNLELLRFLAQRRANFLATTNDAVKENALHLAAAQGHTHVVEFLLNSEKRLVARDFAGNTPLYHAVNKGKVDVAALLLKANDDPNYKKNGNSLVGVAIEQRHPQILRLLLENGAICDKSLVESYRGRLSPEDMTDKEILAIIEQYESNEKALFVAARTGDIRALRAVLVAGASVQSLDGNYNSVLHVALSNKRLECCALLLVEGAEFASLEYSSNPFEKLLPAELTALRNFLVDYFQRPPEAVVAYFVSRTRLACQNKFRLGAQIDLQSIYSQLYNNGLNQRFVRPVLEVLEYSPQVLDVIFDCSVDNVARINPTQGKGSRGSCDFKNAKIYIGAKRSPFELLGTVAHEFTHLVCQQLFQYECNPYTNGSVEESAFLEIYREIKTRREAGYKFDTIIERAFSEYPEPIQPSELIVRVPHMIAEYGEEGLRELQDQAPKLLEFYVNVLIPQCVNFVKMKNSEFIRSGATQITMQDSWGLLAGADETRVNDTVSLHALAERGLLDNRTSPTGALSPAKSAAASSALTPSYK